MSITWRTVTAPNQGAANNLAAKGIETILSGLGTLGERLKKPDEDAKIAAEKLFEKQLKQATLAQGDRRIGLESRRIDNQETQYDKTAAARLAAAELAREHDLNLNKLDADQQAKRDAKANERAIELAQLTQGFDARNSDESHRKAKDLIEFEANLKAAKQGKSSTTYDKSWGKTDPGLDPTVEEFIKNNPTMDTREIPRLRNFVRVAAQLGNPRDAVLNRLPQLFSEGALWGLGDDTDKHLQTDDLQKIEQTVFDIMGKAGVSGQSYGPKLTEEQKAEQAFQEQLKKAAASK